MSEEDVNLVKAQLEAIKAVAELFGQVGDFLLNFHEVSSKILLGDVAKKTAKHEPPA